MGMTLKRSLNLKAQAPPLAKPGANMLLRSFNNGVGSAVVIVTCWEGRAWILWTGVDDQDIKNPYLQVKTLGLKISELGSL